MPSLAALEQVERRIYFIRGHKVILDADLAALYDVSTKRFKVDRRSKTITRVAGVEEARMIMRSREAEGWMKLVSAAVHGDVRGALRPLQRGRGRSG